MTATYCAWCGSECTTAPCPHCGRIGTTVEPPSHEPCAYCGARPTWPVTWEDDGGSYTTYLCAECDEQEEKWLEESD
jgi:hypothetical protein